MNLDNLDEPKEILSYNSLTRTNKSIDLTINDKYMYWYEYNEELEHPVELYRYDLINEEVSKLKSELDKGSARVIIKDNLITSSASFDDYESIYINDIDGEIEEIINVYGKVSNPICNEDICIWAKGYESTERNQILVYNRKTNEYESIDVDDIFSYSVLDNYVLINDRNNLYVYNIENKEYFNILSEEDFIFYIKNSGNDIFFRVQSDKTGIHRFYNLVSIK